MSDPDTARRMAKQHPTLIEAANNIAAHIHESTTSPQDQAGTSTGYSYSLEALSDEDEEMESSNDLSRNSSYNAITAAHLAAAIANATGQVRPSPGGVITSEMFSSAIQQAFASSGGRNDAENGTESLTRRYQAQLQQMREIGLSNEGVNIRALQATSGDVQAAIELVFNGVID